MSAAKREQNRTVVVTGAGSRGLCAGGDIRWIYGQLAENMDEVRRFWRAEYELDALIALLRHQDGFGSLVDRLDDARQEAQERLERYRDTPGVTFLSTAE